MKLNERELLAAIARKHLAQITAPRTEPETVAQFLARGGRVQTLPGFVHSPDLRRRGQQHYRQGGAQ